MLFNAEHNGKKILEPKSTEKSRVSSVNIAQHAGLCVFQRDSITSTFFYQYCLYIVHWWFLRLMEKFKSKFLLASIKLLTNNFENPYSNPLQRPNSGDLILRIHTGSRLLSLTLFRNLAMILHSRKSTRIKDENRPMAEKKSCIEILMRISIQYLELVSVTKNQAAAFQLFSLLQEGQKISAFTKSNDFI